MIVSVLHISKTIERKEVIKNISFNLYEGEIVALVGPNGAGKTTLLSILTNMITPDKGNVEINKYDLKKNPTEALQSLAFMQDNTTLYSHLSGYDHLKFIAGIKKKSKEDIETVIEKLEIGSYMNKKVGKYSLGMKQHLLLAIALLSQPKILIMDEPLNGLDPTSSLLVRDIIIELRKNGTTVLFSSHLLGEVDKVADRIIFIKNGEKIAENKIKELISTTRTYKLKLKEPENAYNLLKDHKSILVLNFDNENNLQMETNENEFGNILTYCAQVGIEIFDIEKTNFQTEKTYHKIYGEKND